MNVQRIYKHFSIVVAVVLLIMLSSCTSQGKKEGADTSRTADVINELPDLSVTYLDGSRRSLKDLNGKIVLVLFQPDCDHCQREAEQIQKHLQNFNGYHLHFISSAEMKDIETFARNYHLFNEPDVSFGSTTGEGIVKSFGPISAPSLYIYREGKLIESFNGEVAIEVVLKYV